MAISPIFGEVYLLTNLVNGKMYVGQTTQGVSRRWRHHTRGSRSNKTPAYNNYLSKAIRKYGSDVFDHQILSTAGSQADLDNLEKIWIVLLQTKSPDGYNLTDGGNSGTIGHIVSSDVRARLSDATRKQWQNPEFRRRYSENRKGKKAHPNTIAKRVEKLKGKKRTPEQIARMSLSHKGFKWTDARRAVLIEKRKKHGA